MDLSELTCLGKDGVPRTFYYEISYNRHEVDAEWCLRVHRRNPPQYNGDDWFELHLTPFDERSLRITMIENKRKDWYRAKGISDAIIPEAARVLQKRIVSSSNRVRVKENEYRTEDAEKVWRRLVAKGLATYCDSSDRYIYQG